jgi:hypothetical protein
MSPYGESEATPALSIIPFPDFEDYLLPPLFDCQFSRQFWRGAASFDTLF